MVKNPLVTVYITNYNYGTFIKESIESVFNQTLQDFELLIIDDGSTDNSRIIIEEYRNNNKVQIIYQQNKGLNITNNIAMRAAKGKYLMRLDADDFLENDALKLMSKTLESNPDVGLVFPDYFYVDAKGGKIGKEKRHNFDDEVSLYDQPAHGACTMIRLDFLRKVGGYNESFTCQDGYDLWIKFIMQYKVKNINKPLFSYRQHGNNLTSSETRILDTRKKIKDHFVNTFLHPLSVLAIIPIRNTFINGQSWPLTIFNDKTILEYKVDLCLKSKYIKKIVITSEDIDIINFSKDKFASNPSIVIIERPQELAAPGKDLYDTIHFSLYQIEDTNEIDALISISLEFPFIQADFIDDAVNTLILFNADTVLSVRPDNKMYYQHNGHGLTPILNQDKFTRLEREALYKSAGGIIITNKKSFLKSKKLISGKISHIIVDEKSSFGVFSKFEFDLFKLLTEKQL